ncbi:SDR family NAD(P)-dependent oxidoreductase [Arthrobacter sp. PM3]|uniref:SDR family NAD(P)-dependent oxidoreductase n=1 Tax=Arthrobacter sp. PM3 TaxID=2017685 RepID=UPI000E106C04|nr:SDR family oxidoreductase [Arthrobacter sp. PM3]AXJ10456.1 dehydrogenase [Arthrobacter sp. PM3]
MSNRPVAIVTGGGTGIGSAAAGALRAQGWEVVISGRRAEPLQRIAEATGAFPVVADACLQQDVSRLVESALARFGSVSGLVLNAGIVRPGSAGELSNEDWDAMIGTNLTGPFRLIREAMPHLLDTNGAIVGVSSAAALRATAGTAGYSATKAGLAMLVQSIAVDYGPRGVRANVVCPGWTRTEMADMEMKEYGAELGLSSDDAYKAATSFVPARRPAEAAEVADVIAWLLSDKASYVNAAVIPVDGGMISVDPGGLALSPGDSLKHAGQP